MYCVEASPFIWSVQDTDATKEQVKKHNRKFVRLCPEEAKRLSR